MKGKKHLITGNHDAQMLKDESNKKYFVSINDILTVKDNGNRIVLCHYPLAEWPYFFQGAYHFFGHIHNNKVGTYEIMKKLDRAYNVGVDIIGPTPLTAEQIIGRAWEA